MRARRCCRVHVEGRFCGRRVGGDPVCLTRTIGVPFADVLADISSDFRPGDTVIECTLAARPGSDQTPATTASPDRTGTYEQRDCVPLEFVRADHQKPYSQYVEACGGQYSLGSSRRDALAPHGTAHTVCRELVCRPINKWE